MQINLCETTEFKEWSEKRQLEPPEQIMLEKYLFNCNKNISILDTGTDGGRFLEELANRGFR